MGIHDDDNAGGFVDPEAPDPSDVDADMYDDTEPCPHCGRVIHEQSDFCPHCGQYVPVGEGPVEKSWWIVLAVVIGIIIVLLWVTQRG
jgi:hypothetical protein